MRDTICEQLADLASGLLQESDIIVPDSAIFDSFRISESCTASSSKRFQNAKLESTEEDKEAARRQVFLFKWRLLDATSNPSLSKKTRQEGHI